MRSPAKFLFAITFVVMFGVYSFTVGRHATGYADSDELLTMAYTWSVAHPSGFPLLIFLTGLVMRCFSGINPALVGNLVGAMSQAFSLACLAVSGFVLLNVITPRKSKMPVSAGLHWWFALFGAVFIGLNGQYWLYGSVLEAPSFTNAFIGMTVMCSLLWWQSLKVSGHHRLWFLLTCLGAGVALSHMHTAILIYPGLLVLLLLQLPRLKLFPWYRRIIPWLSATGAWLSGFVGPNLLLLWFNARGNMFSWYFSPDFQGWWKYILRQDYAGYYPEENVARAAYITRITTQMITAQPEWIRYLFSYMLVPGIVLGILGLVALIRSRHRVFWVIFTWILVAGPVFMGVMGFPENIPGNPEYTSSLGVSYRQCLIAHWFMGLLVIAGLWAGYSWLAKRISVKLLCPVFCLATLCLQVYTGWTFFPMADQLNNTLAESYATSMLTTAKPDSAIICAADLSCFSLMYAQTVHRLRPDVLVLTKNDLYLRRYLQTHPDIYNFSYHDNPSFMSNLLAWNLSRRPVYLTNPTKYYINYIGLDANPFYLIPSGHLFEVVKMVPPTLTNPDVSEFTQYLLTNHTIKLDYYVTGLNGLFSTLHLTSGVLYAAYGYPDWAREHFVMAQSLFPEAPEPQTWLHQLSSYTINDRYKPGAHTTVADLLTKAETSSKSGDLTAAYGAVRKATYLDPQNSLARLELVNLYLVGGYPEDAVLELNHVLRFDPRNQTAQSLLRSLRP